MPRAVSTFLLGTFVVILLLYLDFLPLGALVKRHGENAVSTHKLQRDACSQLERFEKATFSEISSTNAELTPIRLPKNDFTLLHIGKAGGGTFKNRLGSMWNIRHVQCHPTPCRERLQEKDQETVFVITLRDPIDRFVSAFYWRSIVLCHPDGDDRKTNGKAFLNPNKYCEARDRQIETDVIFHKYKRNVSLLAEAMCRNPQGARLDAESIRHARFSIEDWLGHGWRNVTDVLFPVVLENEFDYNLQIDNAVHWVNDRLDFANASDMALRQAHVNRIDCQLLKQQTDTSADLSREVTVSRHSSSLSSRDFALLSSLSESCLALYYKRDYDILRELKEFACKTTLCRDAIQSILDRRAPLLRRTGKDTD